MTKRTKDRSLLLGVLVLLALAMWTCSQAQAAEVTASWLASDGATGYKLYTCDRPDFVGECVQVAATLGTTEATTTVDLNSSTYFRVRAFNGAGESELSNSRHLTCTETDPRFLLYIYSDQQLADAAQLHLNNFDRFGMITSRGRDRLLAVVTELVIRLDDLP